MNQQNRPENQLEEVEPEVPSVDPTKAESSSPWMPMRVALISSFLGLARPYIGNGSMLFHSLLLAAAAAVVGLGVWAFQGSMGWRKTTTAFRLYGARYAAVSIIMNFLDSGIPGSLPAALGVITGAGLTGFLYGAIIYGFGRVFRRKALSPG